MGVFQTIIAFLAVLSLLVLAHELGHFLVAKRAGIKVEEFGLGYPPRLFGIRHGETLYSLNLLPLGGFVRMLGENAEPGDPRSFSSKSILARALVLSAGSGMNFLLVPLLFSVSLMVGEPVPCDTCGHVQVYGVVSGMPASGAGLHEGDVFASINGLRIQQPDEVRNAIRAAGSAEIDLVLLRNGEEVRVRLAPRPNADGLPVIGIQLGPEIVTVQHPVWEAVPLALQRTGDLFRTFVEGIKQIVVREQPAELAGPVGIADMTGRAVRAGPAYLVQFIAFLSMNLAIFNMLPIPGLDGARLAFVLLEMVRRGRRMNPQVEGLIHFAGLMLLITMMLYVSYQDVRRLFPL